MSREGEKFLRGGRDYSSALVSGLSDFQISIAHSRSSASLNRMVHTAHLERQTFDEFRTKVAIAWSPEKYSASSQ